MENMVMGRHARIKKAIVAEGVRIPSHTEIGYSPRKDRKRFTVTPRVLPL
jgi:glucose-1-phosphate adenylyltransferase